MEVVEEKCDNSIEELWLRSQRWRSLCAGAAYQFDVSFNAY
jgi:hypothetical protein